MTTLSKKPVSLKNKTNDSTNPNEEVSSSTCIWNVAESDVGKQTRWTCYFNDDK